MIIQIDHLVKRFGQNEVLKDVSLGVNKGEVISIIGSSGSGKSTLLRCINLLESYQSGSILFEGNNILSSHNDGLWRQGASRRDAYGNENHISAPFSYDDLEIGI
ncbi:MAG: amino acid ABC transporter ATP-binding protein, partial [Erysipelotrichaceae bacterium]|nr:amino acid ABC transporter ATP-binding protein [Erysipelotrichaceae bacterium]